jgi:light-regulated signal transduction histidine kinase (bacteriophytochrome)
MENIMDTPNKSLEEELGLVREQLDLEREQNRQLFVELVVARSELSFQKEEEKKRAAELGVANMALAFEDGEKGKRAVELGIANIELRFQNDEKEKRAVELVIANKELTFQNAEKEKRAAELIIANKELAFQNEEKEKRAEELVIVNTELLAFNYVSSHDLQEPLRKIQTLAGRILDKESQNLSDAGKDYFNRIQTAAGRMRQLIEDLLVYSRTNIAERKFEKVDLNTVIEAVKAELKENIEEKHAIIEVTEMCEMSIIPFQFHQLMHNLLRNALKFSSPKRPPHILIKSRIVKGNELNNPKLVAEKSYCHITVSDNGIGFEPEYKDRIFEVFQKLHGKEKYEGTGIGLAIVKKIVENHHGIVTATGQLNKGATFDIYIPVPED